MAEIIETLPFNFNDIYTEVKNQFNTAGYDIAEGSNTSQLLTSMSYIVSSLNANTALNINETILPYAIQRDNIVSDARNFGYEIQHKVSYVYNLTLRLDGGNFTIPKYTKFTCDGKSYYYLGKQIELQNVEPNTEITVQVKEGTLYTYTDDKESLQVIIDEIVENGVKQVRYYIDIPYINIEENGIEVFCSYTDDYGIFHDKEEWTKSEHSFVEVDTQLKHEFIRIDNIEYKTPRIYFKYAGIGEGLKLGTEVLINILESNGAKGQIEDISKPDKVQCQIANAQCVKIDLVSDGTDEETSDNIKTNAPKAYNSANRLVVANDYVSACKRDGRIKDCIVWGGEDEFPVAPGHIWFTFLPNNDRGFSNDEFNQHYDRLNSELKYDYTIDNEEQRKACEDYYFANYVKNTTIRSFDRSTTGTLINPGIWDKLESLRIPTLEFHNRHPIFCEFQYTFEILKYVISDDKAKVHQEVFDIIDNAFKGNDNVYFESFNSEYFNTSLIKRIDERVSDISGFNMTLKNRLVLNQYTCCTENQYPEYKDIYIPLATSYEKYFDDEGYLIIENMPKIDTKGFVQYLDEGAGDLFVDWSKIEKDIEDSKQEEDIKNKIIQKRQKLIIAPVRIRYKGTYNFADHPGVFKATFKFNIYPDTVSQSEIDEMTFNNTKVYRVRNGEKTLLVYNVDWFRNNEKPNVMTFAPLKVEETDSIEVETTPFCGFYFLFNHTRKEILVHLFIDGSVNGYTISIGDDYSKLPNSDYDEKYLYSYDDNYFFSNNNYYHYTEALLNEDISYVDGNYTTPRSYLNSNDAMYLYTPDKYYLTTNGYAITDEDGENSYTGPIIKEINLNMYKYSGLKYDLFKRNRYLDLKYPSWNFQVIRSVLPQLKSVDFYNVID